jgi:hypothetical protein
VLKRKVPLPVVKCPRYTGRVSFTRASHHVMGN